MSVIHNIANTLVNEIHYNSLWKIENIYFVLIYIPVAINFTFPS